jgi:hypothetical protein
MQLIVIFSYNRALQLDYLIKSIFEKFKSLDFQISIIYHTVGSHELGYEKLINKYKNYNVISFYKRKPKYFNFNRSSFSSLRNLKKSINYSYLFNKKCDDFKELLESILEKTSSEFVMFNTDDGVYFDDVNVDKSVYELIRQNPLQVSFRLYLGKNIFGLPDYVKVENNTCVWNYFTPDLFNHWTCMFSVDGTIYSTKGMLEVLKKVVYHNPITLEANVYDYSKNKQLFSLGMSPIKSSLVCTKLNRVSVDSFNPTISINVDYLNEKLLDNFELSILIPESITNANVVPNEVLLVKDDEITSIYKIDEYGEIVQNALGPEGTKYIV